MHRPGGLNTHMNNVHRSNQLNHTNNMHRTHMQNHQHTMQRHQHQMHQVQQRNHENHMRHQQQYHRHMDENNRIQRENAQRHNENMRRIAETNRRVSEDHHRHMMDMHHNSHSYHSFPNTGNDQMEQSGDRHVYIYLNQGHSLYTPLLSNMSYVPPREQPALSRNFAGNLTIDDSSKSLTAKFLILIAFFTIGFLPLSIALLIWSLLITCEHVVFDDHKRVIEIGKKRCLTDNVSIKKVVPYDQVDHFENKPLDRLVDDKFHTEMFVCTKDGKQVRMCGEVPYIQEKRLKEVQEWWQRKTQPETYTPPTVPPASSQPYVPPQNPSNNNNNQPPPQEYVNPDVKQPSMQTQSVEPQQQTYNPTAALQLTPNEGAQQQQPYIPPQQQFEPILIQQQPQAIQIQFGTTDQQLQPAQHRPLLIQQPIQLVPSPQPVVQQPLVIQFNTTTSNDN
jgi:hypothetical protein